MTKLKPWLSLSGIGVFAVLLLAVAPLMLTDHWPLFGLRLRRRSLLDRGGRDFSLCGCDARRDHRACG